MAAGHQCSRVLLLIHYDIYDAPYSIMDMENATILMTHHFDGLRVAFVDERWGEHHARHAFYMASSNAMSHGGNFNIFATEAEARNWLDAPPPNTRSDATS